MAKVILLKKLSNGYTVVLCESEEGVSFDGELYTNVGPISRDQYLIAEPTKCFNECNVMSVLITADMDCSGIREISCRPIEMK